MDPCTIASMGPLVPCGEVAIVGLRLMVGVWKGRVEPMGLGFLGVGVYPPLGAAGA